MAKKQKRPRPSWIETLKMGATGWLKEKYHTSPAGKKHIRSMKAQGMKWKGGKWVKGSAYYGGAKRGRKTADELLREIKAGK